MRRAVAAAAAVLALLTTSGCTGLQGTEGKEFVSGDGRVQPFAPEDRDAPIESAGTTIDGQPIDIADYRGQVVVATVWASWCGPCRTEMPMFAELDAELPADAAVIGLNTRESSPDNAAALVRTAGVGFPSMDDEGGRRLLDFSSELGGPGAIPSTLVLDREGRLARLILGEAPSKGTMLDIVEDVLAEPTGKAAGAAPGAISGAAPGSSDSPSGGPTGG